MSGEAESSHLEEMLNGFIDGELTERQRTEVQRLLAHDKRFAAKLRDLKKCRELVKAVAAEEPPPGLPAKVAAALEARRLPLRVEPKETRRGARNLAMRQILAVAAMFALVAALVLVVYNILAPQSGTGRYSAPPVAASRTIPAGPAAAGEVLLSCRLEVQTASAASIKAYVMRSIENAGLLAASTAVPADGGSIFAVMAPAGAVEPLLADLENIWPRLGDVGLFVSSDLAGGHTFVPAATAGQLRRVLNSPGTEDAARLAAGYAVANRLEAMMPQKVLASAGLGEPPLPAAVARPVLTSREGPVAAPRISGMPAVSFTVFIKENRP
jgi:negative regulator of sigma E activity